MSRANTRLYEFGPFELDLERRALTREDQVLPLAPKTFDLLVLLVQSPGRAFSKQELMNALWPETFVEEANLSFQISVLRKALDEDGARWVETVPKHGYRFSADVRAAAEPVAQRESIAEPSVVVLPFVNVSADPEYDFFADGLADEFIVALSKLQRVRVVARTSALSFKGGHGDVREIADRLGVNLVLEGSVRKSGTRLRVTAELVNAATGCQIWSERYDREIEMRDIFEVQDELTRVVVGALSQVCPWLRAPSS